MVTAHPAQRWGSGASLRSARLAAQPAAQLSTWYSGSEPAWHERGSASPVCPRLRCWLRPGQGGSAGTDCPVAQREAHLRWQEGSWPLWNVPAASLGPPATLLLSLLLGKQFRAPQRMLQSLALHRQGKQGAQPSAGVPCSGPIVSCSAGTGAAEPSALWRQEPWPPQARLHPAGAILAALYGAGGCAKGLLVWVMVVPPPKLGSSQIGTVPQPLLGARKGNGATVRERGCLQRRKHPTGSENCCRIGLEMS